MPAVLYINEDIIEIRHEQLELLELEARLAPLKRARFCLHKSDDDAIQEMIIALNRESYIPPHRHKKKSESYHIIKGNLGIVLFDDQANILRKISLMARSAKATFLFRITNESWHTVVSLSETAIYHEITNGPFLKNNNDIALWAPDPADNREVSNFLTKMRDHFIEPVVE